MQAPVDVAQLRAKHRRIGLDEQQLNADALVQFERWYAEWTHANSLDASTVVLATADPVLGPSARLMRLAGVDRGFVFFTDCSSRKGRELLANPKAALCFAWGELGRQVRVQGLVEPVESVEVDSFFRGQPMPAQLLAWASDQRSVLHDRAALLARMKHVEHRFAGKEVPRPEHWGGFRLVPSEVEFWQGRADGLADRLRYTRPSPGAAWRIERMAP